MLGLGARYVGGGAGDAGNDGEGEESNNSEASEDGDDVETKGAVQIIGVKPSPVIQFVSGHQPHRLDDIVEEVEPSDASDTEEAVAAEAELDVEVKFNGPRGRHKASGVDRRSMLGIGTAEGNLGVHDDDLSMEEDLVSYNNKLRMSTDTMSTSCMLSTETTTSTSSLVAAAAPKEPPEGSAFRLAWFWVQGWRNRLSVAGDIVEECRWEWRMEDVTNWTYRASLGVEAQLKDARAGSLTSSKGRKDKQVRWA